MDYRQHGFWAVLVLMPSIARASSADAETVATELTSWLWLCGFAVLCLVQFALLTQQARPQLRWLARAFGLTLLLFGLATLSHERHQLQQRQWELALREGRPYDWEVRNFERQETKTRLWWGGVAVVALSLAATEAGRLRSRRRLA
ncbi:MAG: hypothetical protein ACOZQL_25490 [Myxococcota bacterium]